MSDRPLIRGAALVFLASAAITVYGCAAMASMPGMAMPGGWTMSMAWMRMPGQDWVEAGAAFLGMWAVMMIAMMMPALVPMLASYRRARGRRGTWPVATSYFGVWCLLGALVYPLGVFFAEWTMREPRVSALVPVASGLVMLAAGALQFTGWKVRQLARCRHSCASPFASAWRHGWELGLRCVRCCAGLTALLLVLGVMEVWAMALVTLAISAERLSPGTGVARAVGTVLLLSGGYQLLLATV